MQDLCDALSGAVAAVDQRPQGGMRCFGFLSLTVKKKRCVASELYHFQPKPCICIFYLNFVYFLII